MLCCSTFKTPRISFFLPEDPTGVIHKHRGERAGRRTGFKATNPHEYLVLLVTTDVPDPSKKK